MRLRVVLALACASVPLGARATNGRLALSVLAGGGYASDVFVGAGVGQDAFVQVTPAARLDLSLAPAWKLGAAADASYGRYLASEVTSLVETAALEGRWLPDPLFDVTLTAGAEHGSYALGSPLDPGSTASPSVTSTVAGSASSLLRLRSLGLEWRAAGVVTTRSSTSAGVDVSELDRAVLAGAMFPVGAHGSLSVTYKLARNDSARPDFALTAHAVFALVSWRLEALDLQAQAQVQLQTGRLGTGTREELARVTLGVSYALAEALDTELTYSFAGAETTDPLRPSASRHLAFLGLRWRAAVLAW